MTTPKNVRNFFFCLLKTETNFLYCQTVEQRFRMNFLFLVKVKMLNYVYAQHIYESITHFIGYRQTSTSSELL